MYYQEAEGIFDAIEDGKTDRDNIYVPHVKGEASLGSAKPIIKIYTEEWCNDFLIEDRKITGKDGEIFNISLLLETLFFQPKAFEWLKEQFDNNEEDQYLYVSLSQYKRMMNYINAGKVNNDNNVKNNFKRLDNFVLDQKNTDKELKEFVQERKAAFKAVTKILKSMGQMLEQTAPIENNEHVEIVARYAKINRDFIPVTMRNEANALIQRLKVRVEQDMAKQKKKSVS